MGLAQHHYHEDADRPAIGAWHKDAPLLILAASPNCQVSNPASPARHFQEAFIQSTIKGKSVASSQKKVHTPAIAKGKQNTQL